MESGGHLQTAPVPRLQLQTWKPISKTRIRAIQFEEYSDRFAGSFPVRVTIIDEDKGLFRHELWVDSRHRWEEVAPGDYIVVNEDTPGYTVVSKAIFEDTYERAVS